MTKVAFPGFVSWPAAFLKRSPQHIKSQINTRAAATAGCPTFFTVEIGW